MTAATASATEPARFAAMRDRLIDVWLDRWPGWGRALGFHDRYDAKLSDYSAAAISRAVAAGQKELADLTSVDASSLSPDDALDLALMKRSATRWLFDEVDVGEPTTRPTFYAELFGVNDYLDKEYAPLEERAKRLLSHEEAALTQVAHIRENLKLPLSNPIAKVAVRVFAGYASYLRGEVQTRLKAVGDDAFRARFAATNERLAVEATKISEWLERDVVPTGDDSHVLGVARYKKLLEVQEGLSMPLADFKRQGEADLAANKAAFEALAAKGTTLPRPKAADYLATATTITEEARRFVVDHQLVTIPTNDRAIVRETPPFARWNPASLDMTGAFETPVSAFFNVTLPDPSLPQEQQDEYVQTFAALRMTTAHEVYPGHFVQGLWSYRAPSKFQKMVWSYSFGEGWAHYVEQMMLEQGFGGGDPANAMGQLQQALMRDCRYVVSLGIHTEGMTIEQGEQRFMNDCHLDKANAHEQTVRGTFDPGYFAYTLGKLQILALRGEAKKRLGGAFSLQRFHDALLSHGTPPVALIHDRVLADLTTPAR
jgi:hypothetical protein